MRTRLLRSLLAVVLAEMLALPTSAQRALPTGVRAQDTAMAVEVQRPTLLDAQQRAPERAAYEIPVRTALGIGGAFIGAYGGALVGANVIPHSPCYCDDPGLTEAVEGAAIGSALLSAVLASAPQMSSGCHPVRRFAYGAVGALTGAVAGGALGATLGGAGVLFGYLAGAGLGAGISSGVCR
jgi:hypothetical protein